MTTRDDKDYRSGVHFVDELNGAIRENPVSAGLIGLGVLWMFVGRARIATFATALPQTTKQVTKAIHSVAETAGDTSFETDVNSREKVRPPRDDGKTSNKENEETIASAGQSAARASIELGHQIGQSIQQNVTMTIEQQPLLLGVLGVSIGAGIASMFSSTEAEHDLLGDAGAAVKAKIRDLAEQTAQRAEQVLDDVKNEARNQDLTVAAGEESLKAAVEKVKITTGAVRESLSSRL